MSALYTAARKASAVHGPYRRSSVMREAGRYVLFVACIVGAIFGGSVVARVWG